MRTNAPFVEVDESGEKIVCGEEEGAERAAGGDEVRAAPSLSASTSDDRGESKNRRSMPTE